MSKKQSGRLEKNIYVEARNGSFRFKVVVHPLQDSATFSTLEEGARWARRRRVELLEIKVSAKVPGSPEGIQTTPAILVFHSAPKLLLLSNWRTCSTPMLLSDETG